MAGFQAALEDLKGHEKWEIFGQSCLSILWDFSVV